MMSESSLGCNERDDESRLVIRNSEEEREGPRAQGPSNRAHEAPRKELESSPAAEHSQSREELPLEVQSARPMRIASPAVEKVPQAEEEQTTMRVPSDEESPAGPGSDTVATPTPADSMPEAGLDLPAFPLLATFGPRADSTLQIANNETREGYLRACTLVETLAEWLDDNQFVPITIDPMRRTFRLLLRYCRDYSIIPGRYLIPSGSLSKARVPVMVLGDLEALHRGQYACPEGGFVDVALKVIRTTLRTYPMASESERIRERICQEIILWRRLSQHARITQMIGVEERPNEVWIVSKWMKNGALSEYLDQHLKDASLNRLQLLVDVCEGLQHLHSQGVAHGDLKCGNIVIDEEGRANLYDFGSAILVYKLESINATTRFDCRGTILCMAPEVLDPEENGLQYSHASFEADIYALAMVMWQVFSEDGKGPWHGFSAAQIVTKVAHRGVRPRRHSGCVSVEWGLTDDMWSLIEHCWHQDLRQRPPVGEVLERLKIALAAFNGGQ